MADWGGLLIIHKIGTSHLKLKLILDLDDISPGLLFYKSNGANSNNRLDIICWIYLLFDMTDWDTI